jgi:hypothetical protein
VTAVALRRPLQPAGESARRQHRCFEKTERDRSNEDSRAPDQREELYARASSELAFAHCNTPRFSLERSLTGGSSSAAASVAVSQSHGS